MIKSFLFYISFFLLSGIYSCDNVAGKKQYMNTDMYNFSNPKILELPTDLDEISGIAYYPKDTSVFAIVDEAGTLYKIPLKNPQAFQHWNFGKKKDYEDLLLKDSTFYILVSNGNIDKVDFSGSKVYNVSYDFITHKKKKNEFETIFVNADNEVTLICKDCEDDDKSQLSTFIFSDSASEHFRDGKTLDMNGFIQKIGVKKHLKPSAAAINPITHDLYLLSSIMKVILIINPRGQLKEMVELNPRIYKMPEGLTFTPEGNLIISNEFADEGLPTLLLLKNKKQ